MLRGLMDIVENLNRNISVYFFIDGFIDNTDSEQVTECIDLCRKTKIKNKSFLFSEKNLGCGLGPIAAISWFFSNETMGIILEDDCRPDISFFDFCHMLLLKYENNERIFHISGSQFDETHDFKSSYVFSQQAFNWGWASWKRAWEHYDYFIIPDEERRTIWDYQWQKTIHKFDAITILPAVNLVQNIGYGNDATHTTLISDCHIRKINNIKFPLIHPELNFDNLFISKIT